METEVEGALTGTTDETVAAVAVTVEHDKEAVAAARKRTEVTGGQVEIKGGLVTTGEVTEAVVLENIFRSGGTGIGVIFDLHRMIGT